MILAVFDGRIYRLTRHNMPVFFVINRDMLRCALYHLLRCIQGRLPVFLALFSLVLIQPDFTVFLEDDPFILECGIETFIFILAQMEKIALEAVDAVALHAGFM